MSTAADSEAARRTHPIPRARPTDAGNTPHAEGTIPENSLNPGFPGFLQVPHILLPSDSVGDVCDHCTQQSEAYCTHTAQMTRTLSDTAVENPDSVTLDSEFESSTSGSSSSSEYIQPAEGSASETEDDCERNRRPQLFRRKLQHEMNARGRRHTTVQNLVRCPSPPSLAQTAYQHCFSIP